MERLERIRNFIQLTNKYLKDIQGRDQSRELDYDLHKVSEYVDFLFNVAAPLKVGDFVRLVRPVKISRDSGWYSCRHFIKEGAVAEVLDVDVSGGRFRVSVSFELESWKPEKTTGHYGKLLPITAKHSFGTFTDSYFVRLSEEELVTLRASYSVNEKMLYSFYCIQEWLVGSGNIESSYRFRPELPASSFPGILEGIRDLYGLSFGSSDLKDRTVWDFLHSLVIKLEPYAASVEEATVITV